MNVPVAEMIFHRVAEWARGELSPELPCRVMTETASAGAAPARAAQGPAAALPRSDAAAAASGADASTEAGPALAEGGALRGGAPSLLPAAGGAAAEEPAHDRAGGAAAHQAGSGALQVPLALPKYAQPYVLDVCCGTGVIGLTLAASARQVVGLELVEAAVEDARRNADNNKVANAAFIAGRAEVSIDLITGGGRGRVGGTAAAAALPAGVRLLPGEACIAVVDPPRCGLHANVIKFLRGCREIKRIAYVSCNPVDSMLRDVGMLMRRQKPIAAGADDTAFRPVRMTSFDMCVFRVCL